MLKFLFILICFLSVLTIRAQQVTNIEITQEGNNVVITYDISSDKPRQTFDIEVECSTDNGKTYSIVPSSLSGDLKEIMAGSGKRIVWDVLSERQELTGDQFVFQLVATANNPEDSYSGNSGTFTDYRDGQVYKWVRIGRQIWMAENLRTTKYRGFTSIPNVTDNKIWTNLKTPGYCWYNNDLSNKYIYGALYNWYAVNTGKLAPTGWHVPTDTEFAILLNRLGKKSIVGGKLKEAGKILWQSPNIGATNVSGFTALPSGFRGIQGTFCDIGNRCLWWSSTEEDRGMAWLWSVDSNTSDLDRLPIYKVRGLSIRCVKD